MKLQQKAEDFTKRLDKKRHGQKGFRKETIEEAREMDDIMIDCGKIIRNISLLYPITHLKISWMPCRTVY